MVTRQLGSQGPEISTVGFGSWALGGQYEFGWGPVDDAESVAVSYPAFWQDLEGMGEPGERA